MLTIEWYKTQSNVMINMLAHPKTTTTPENNIPVYASRSKCSSILLLSVYRRTVGTWRIFLQPVSEKWLSILFKYRSDGRSPFLPKSCLFWLAAMAKATTAKKKKKNKTKQKNMLKATQVMYIMYVSLLAHYSAGETNVYRWSSCGFLARLCSGSTQWTLVP